MIGKQAVRQTDRKAGVSTDRVGTCMLEGSIKQTDRQDDRKAGSETAR